VPGLGWRCGGGKFSAGACCEEAGTDQHISAASVTAARREENIMKKPLGIENPAAALT
jgi:hypothetical protein